MAHKYNIDDLKYIYSLKHKRKAVVYYDGERNKYIDVNSNRIMANRNQRLYAEKNISLLGDLNRLLDYYGIWVLLINSKGEKQLNVTAEIINEIMFVFEKIRSFDDFVIKKIEEKASLVTDICINSLNISNEQQTSLRNLLYNYIFVDTAINGVNEKKIVITKENKMMDYKILRSLKFLGIDVNVENIPNFKIEYNLDSINYYDSKGNKIINDNLDKNKQKIKQIIDKRSI